MLRLGTSWRRSVRRGDRIATRKRPYDKARCQRDEQGSADNSAVSAEVRMLDMHHRSDFITRTDIWRDEIYDLAKSLPQAQSTPPQLPSTVHRNSNSDAPMR